MAKVAVPVARAVAGMPVAGGMECTEVVLGKLAVVVPVASVAVDAFRRVVRSVGKAEFLQVRALHLCWRSMCGGILAIGEACTDQLEGQTKLSSVICDREAKVGCASGSNHVAQARVWWQVQVANAAVLHLVASVLSGGKLAALLPVPVGRCVVARIGIALVAMGGGGGLLAWLLWLV
eukprot:9987523-Ditylum_brightwellii.AAC.1